MALARLNLTAIKLKLMTMAPLGFVGLSAGTLLLAAAAMNWVEGKLPPAYHYSCGTRFRRDAYGFDTQGSY